MKLHLMEALLLSVSGHHGQYDRGGMPYAFHPIKVMHYLKTTDEDLMCVALLHDIVEDSDGRVTIAQIREKFNDRIANGVDAMTKRAGESYEGYIERLKGNIDAVRVKMADLRHNTDIRRLKGVTEKDIERTKRYHETFVDLQVAELTHMNMLKPKKPSLVASILANQQGINPCRYEDGKDYDPKEVASVGVTTQHFEKSVEGRDMVTINGVLYKADKYIEDHVASQEARFDDGNFGLNEMAFLKTLSVEERRTHFIDGLKGTNMIFHPYVKNRFGEESNG